MKRWPAVLLLFAMATCAPAEDELVKQAANFESIVWPEPPQQARIRLVGIFGEPEDLGIRRSIFSRFWGWIAGAAPREMVRPYAIAAEGQRIAVTDPGVAVVHLFDTGGRKYTRIDSVDKELLSSPVGVALAEGRLYVADSALGRIFVLDDEGKPLRTIAGLQRPTGIAWHGASGRLFAVDTTGHKVAAFGPDEQLLFEFGRRGTGDGEFNFPSHVTIWGDRLYVNDTMNFRIQIFDLDGKFVSSFGSHGDGSGDFAQPKGVGVDSEGHIYVVDALFNRVQIFDDRGRLLLAFGKDGGEPGGFWLPSGVYISQDRIYVADSYNRRVQIFEFLGGT